MLTLDPANALALEATANALIVNALTHGAPGFPSPLCGEVKAAHATVIVGASQVAAAWSPILAPFDFEVRSTAVLIHKSPMVNFIDAVTGKQEQRELADTLVVIDMLDGGKVADRRAALTQAKLATRTGHISLGSGDSSGKAQRNLYLHWPKFTLQKGYSRHARDLNDINCLGLAADGCRFGGIDLHGSRRDWMQIPTAQRMNARRKPSLGTSLMGMACGSSGRPAVAHGTDPWSELIDELMTVTFGLTYPDKRGPLRSWETMSFVVASPSFVTQRARSIALFKVGGVPPGDGSVKAEASEPARGISIIHIELVKVEERS